jgi:hypothetical protein
MEDKMHLCKNVKLGLFISGLITLSGCGGVDKGAFTDQQICIATVAATTGRNASIIKIDSIQSDVTYLSYNRQDDGKHWAYRCKLYGNKVIWASDTGRWRTGQYDSKITFSVSGNKINISEKYSDDSGGVKSYSLSQLGG